MACLVSLACSPVERDHQGEIFLVGDPDSPSRAAKVLGQLRSGALALGYEPAEAWQVVLRVAGDSMPKLRRLAFRALADGGSMTTSAVATKVAHPTKTTHRALEDLAVHGVAHCEHGGAGKADIWSLAGGTRQAADLLAGERRDIPTTDISGSLAGTEPEEMSGGHMSGGTEPEMSGGDI